MIRWFYWPYLTGISLLSLLAGGVAPSAQGQVPAAQVAPAVPACPVLTPVRGYLAALFIMDGQYVKRGQPVAKVETANGHAPSDRQQ